MSEKYVGVKFEIVRLPEEKIEDPRIEELIRAGKELSAKGFCPENCGNLSFRRADACLPSVGQGFVITRAGSELGKLTAKDFALVKDVDIAEKKVYVTGKTAPSSESMMHFLIYGSRQDISVILHAHALKLQNAVTTTEEYPYATVECAKSAAALLRKHDLIILKNHGFVSIGETVEEALRKI